MQYLPMVYLSNYNTCLSFNQSCISASFIIMYRKDMAFSMSDSDLFMTHNIFYPCQVKGLVILFC